MSLKSNARFIDFPSIALLVLAVGLMAILALV